MKHLCWLCLVALCLFASCAGDDGGGGSGDDGGNRVSGHVFKGRFTSGQVEAFAIDAAGTAGASLGTDSIDGSGRFSINVGDHAGPLLLRVTVGSFDDEVAGTLTQTAPLEAVLPAPQAGTVISPLSSIAAARALRLISLGDPAVTAITRARSMVAAYYGLTGLDMTPAILSEGPATAGPATDFGAVLAAISRAAADLGVAPDAYAAALAQDAADGSFDGMDGAGVILLGGNPLASDAANVALAAALTAFLGSAANQSGLVAGDFAGLSAHLLAIGPALMFATDVVVTPAARTVGQGMRVPFRALATFSDGSSGDVTATATWDSSNSGVATAAPQGLATAQFMAGSADITATLDIATGSAVMTVGAYTLSSITVTPASPSVYIGGTVNFAAMASYSDLSSDDITDLVAWASGTPAALGLAPAGVGTGMAAGSSLVTATEPGTGISGNTTATVYVSWAANLQFLFGQNCTSCHGGSFPVQNLNLSSYPLAMSTGNSWPNIIIAGDAANSIIVQRLEGTITPQMPYNEPPLAAAQIQMVKDWINAGALNN